MSKIISAYRKPGSTQNEQDMPHINSIKQLWYEFYLEYNCQVHYVAAGKPHRGSSLNNIFFKNQHPFLKGEDRYELHCLGYSRVACCSAFRCCGRSPLA